VIKSRRMALTGDMIGAYRDLEERTDGRRPFGGPRRRLENMKI
jgi:hypothetical protein